MLLKVYDQFKNPIGYIRKYTDLVIESELESGDKTLSFTYQRKDLKLTDEASYLERSSVLGEMVLGRTVLGTSGDSGEQEYLYIENECYIETPDDRYVVKEIEKSSDGYPEISCQLDLETLEADMVESFSAVNVSIQDAANLAIAGTGWRADTEGIDPEKLRSVATLKATRLTILGKIRDAWMCELKYDTKNQIVYFRDQFGEDKGVFFSKQLNLRKLKLTDDSYDYYTRIVPIGDDDLRINDVNDGVGYVENYQYSNKIRTLIWEDTSYTDAQALKDDAEAKLDDMSKPARSYSADIVALAKQKPEYSVLDFGLGDTITLLDQDSGIKDKQRIVSMKEYPDDPYKNSCDLSNTTLTWEEMQSKLQAAADAFEDISNADGTVNGYYVHGVTSDGVVVVETVINGDGSTTTKSVGSLTDNLVTISDNASTALDTAISVAGDVVNISGELDAVSARIGTLEVTALTVTEADIRYAKIEDLQATTIEVENLYGLYADIESIIATELVAEIASINDLLAGNVGSGTVQTIHLTADNVVIDDAIITSAMIYDLSADKISSGTIYTDYVKIANNEGQNLWIDGATIQIIDENDIVRVQIGLDESGDYNLYLWNALGDLIWNAAGLTEDGLLGNGAIIRNDAVADDANISGYKLDIESVAERLEDGVLVLDAAQVTIDGDTLDYKLTEMTQTIDRISNDSIVSVTNYYALGGADEPPCDPGETIAGAILGEMILGEAELGFVGWTTERLVASESEYLWFSQRIEYVDGTIIWTTPTLITDDWIRSSVSTMITELSVIQGQIAGKIWESDITEATNGIWETVNSITDSYSDLIITVNGITEDVGSISTTVSEHYREMTEEFSSITVEIGNISSTVSSVEERVENIESYAVTATTTEYYKSTSATECVGGQWTTQAPEQEEGYYIWMRLTITYGVGSESEAVTTDPVCLTTTGDISVQEIVPYYSVSESNEWIQPHDTSDATLVGSAIVGTSIIGLDGVWTTEQPEINEYEYLWMSYLVTYSNGDTTWTDPTCLTDKVVKEQITTLKQEYTSIEQTINTITLKAVSTSSDGALGGVASIILDAGGHETEAELDLTNVRRSFADDTSSITISAGRITFDTGTLVIYSNSLTLDSNGDLEVDTNQFSLTKAGNATFSGTLNAATGTFAGSLSAVTGSFTSIYTGSHSSYDSTVNGFYAGTDGMSLGSKLQIDNTGAITATSLELSGSSSTLSLGTYFKVNNLGQVFAWSPRFVTSIRVAIDPFSSPGIGDVENDYNYRIILNLVEDSSLNSLSIGNTDVERLYFYGTRTEINGSNYENYMNLGVSSQNNIMGKTYVWGDFYAVNGTKSEIVITQDFGAIAHYCYETASPYFGDMGDGLLDENGECFVFLDDMFLETIESGTDYLINLTPTDEKGVYVDYQSITNEGFIVKGTPNARFYWEVKAKQKNYSNTRLDYCDTEIPDHDQAELELIEEMNDQVKDVYSVIESEEEEYLKEA